MKIDIKEKFKVITPDDGKVLTTWTSEKDILEFQYCEIIYAPLNAEIDEWLEITKEEAEELDKQREAAEEKQNLREE